MSSPLTILLPLKGRHLHTLRFLWHANNARMPYHFLIADGLVNPVIVELMERSAEAFPNLDIEYIRYPDDETLSHFYRKMVDASQRVRTRYVMQAGNDDFPIMSGIDRCLDFLRANPDFSSCSGGFAAFEMKVVEDAKLRHVVGQILRFVPLAQSRRFPDTSADSAAQRIREAFGCADFLYYAVFRAEILATILQELAELNFTDTHLHENYFSLRGYSLGKVRSDLAVVTYISQIGTSLPLAAENDWVKHLLRCRFTSDWEALLSRICASVGTVEVIDKEQFADEIRDLYAPKLRAALQWHYAAQATPPVRPLTVARRWARAVAPRGVVKAVEDLHRLRCRESIFAVLRSSGALDEYISTFRRECADLERTLEGTEFAEFVHRHAPSLLVDGEVSRGEIGRAAAE